MTFTAIVPARLASTRLPDKPLADIIRDWRRGPDREANFKLLFERYFGQVCRFFQRRLHHHGRDPALDRSERHGESCDQ